MVTFGQFIIIDAICLIASIIGIDKGLIHIYTDEEMGLVEYYKNLGKEEDK